MINRLLLTAFSTLILASCQNQTQTEKAASPSLETNIQPETPASTTPMKSNKPEMSVGLPPDAEAVETANKEAQNMTQDKSGVIYLREGENRFLKEYEMNVTFKGMSEDSRCPEGVNCVWAGVAVADIELMGLATRPTVVKLSTMNDIQKGYTRAQNFNGYTISLVEVTPQTTSNKGFNSLKGSYRIGLKFDKGGSAPVAPRTTTK